MTPTSQPFALCSRRLVTPEGVREGAVLVQDGFITEVIAPGRIPPSFRVEDVGDRAIMPGLVDPHVHINEPGRAHWEGFETATRAAAAGGITTVVDMPLNATPVTTTVGAFQEKVAAAHGKLWVDCGFYGGLVPENVGALEALLQAGVLGIKAFLIPSGIDDFPNVTEPILRAAMPVFARYGVPLLVHAELDRGQHGARPAVPSLDPASYKRYLASRPSTWEQDAIALMVELCRTTGGKVHIVHLSAAEALPALREARASGLPLTVETCPHYLFFTAEGIPDGDTRFKCAPPIRTHANREQLWQGLQDGVIDSIASDHSPCPPSLKPRGDFQNAWGGVASLQLGLSVVWTEARKRGYGLTDVMTWMCQRPARQIGCGHYKGSIQPGYRADLVVWQPEARFTVTPSMLHHRHKETPYEGSTLWGQVEQTFVGGVSVFKQGMFENGPSGEVVLGGGRPNRKEETRWR